VVACIEREVGRSHGGISVADSRNVFSPKSDLPFLRRLYFCFFILALILALVVILIITILWSIFRSKIVSTAFCL
jgi:hypothetical protein